METRSLILSNRLREVFLDGTWIANTNYREQLSGLNWQQAVHKVNNLNTIAALTYHINYYLEGLLRAFETGKLEISDKYSFNVPEIQSESAWSNLKRTFLDNSEKFIGAVRAMSDSLLDEPFVYPKYGTYLRNIEGVIEHSYYHLGQISLIKKMIQSS